jgi:hypothetical protein
MIVLALCAALVGGLAAGATSAEPLSEPRLAVCLNGDWMRHVGGGPDAVPERGWETVRVPEYHRSAAEGSAWFRLDFRIPAEFGGPGRRVLLRFVRVRHYARVFLNAQPCGENYGMRAPFEVDVTDAARPGETNRLEVWVHSCSPDYAMPGKRVEAPQVLHRLSTFMGYRDQATIAEDIFLAQRPELHVSDVLVMPSVRERRLSVRLTVTNDSGEARGATLSGAVFLGEEQALSLPERTVNLPAGGSTTTTVSAPWRDARLWGYPPYGEPVLYHLVTRLTDGAGTPVDRLVTRFGFRELWTEGTRIIFNGRPLRVMGYWVPEGSGRAVWTLRMAAVQSLGCNAIHNHAEQREPAFYEVADELGLLVWDANYCGGPLGTTENMSDAPFPDVLAELARQYPLWAKTVANHPSVGIMMMECLFNLEAASRLGEVYKGVDPTRLIHAGGGMARPLDLAACASNFEMQQDDPLANIRSTHQDWARALVDFEGTTLPVVNKEIWYKDDWRDPASPEAIARATRDAIEWLAGTNLAGFALYNQQAFAEQEPLDEPIRWPSRSGESQHPTNVWTGGHAWDMRVFVNFWDPERPAVRPRPTAGAMREAAPDYVGHEVPVANARRPQVIVTVTRDGNPVPDAYVYAVPVEGTLDRPAGMRTDGRGAAWFALREPGRYRFLCRDGGAWRSAELEAPLQPLDLSTGGMGNILEVALALRRRPRGARP